MPHFSLNSISINDASALKMQTKQRKIKIKEQAKRANNQSYKLISINDLFICIILRQQ